MMKYYIEQKILGNHLQKAITADDFNDIKKSREVLFSAKAIEEKYDLLVENYLEFEQEILSQLVKSMVFYKPTYKKFYEIISVLNRRIVNFLTSARMYSDQIQKHVRACMENSADEEGKAKSFFSAEYDLYSDYRFMEALRNYVQHNGLAVHLIRHASERNEINGNSKQLNQLRIIVRKKDLLLDRSFKRSVLKDFNEEIDLIKAVRVYISALSRVHNNIRQQIKINVTSAREYIKKTIEDYEAKNNGESTGLYAYSLKQGAHELFEEYSIFLEWDDVRIILEEKNIVPLSMVSRYVSNHI